MRSSNWQIEKEILTMLKIGFICCALLAMVGCSGTPPMVADAQPVSGTLMFADGKPVPNVMVQLQPLGEGHLVMMEVDEAGNFTGQVIPGEYAYFITQSAKLKNPKSGGLSKVPPAYQEASMERKITVNPKGDLNLTIEA